MNYLPEYSDGNFDLITTAPPPAIGEKMTVTLGNGKYEKWEITNVIERKQELQTVWYIEHKVIAE
jgi:hypothetical protein